MDVAVDDARLADARGADRDHFEICVGSPFAHRAPPRPRCHQRAAAGPKTRVARAAERRSSGHRPTRPTAPRAPRSGASDALRTRDLGRGLAARSHAACIIAGFAAPTNARGHDGECDVIMTSRAARGPPPAPSPASPWAPPLASPWVASPLRVLASPSFWARHYESTKASDKAMTKKGPPFFLHGKTLLNGCHVRWTPRHPVAARSPPPANKIATTKTSFARIAQKPSRTSRMRMRPMKEKIMVVTKPNGR